MTESEHDWNSIQMRGEDTFQIGDQVCKRGEGQRLRIIGEVRAVFLKKSGALRYVVEDDRGVVHIFSNKDLCRYIGPPTMIARIRTDLNYRTPLNNAPLGHIVLTRTDAEQLLKEVGAPLEEKPHEHTTDATDHSGVFREAERQ